MWRRFLEGCFEGLAFVIAVIIILGIAFICGLPFTLALMYCNAWWLILYIIIVPCVFGIYHIFEGIDV